MKKKLAPLLTALALLPAAGYLLAETPATSEKSIEQPSAPSYLGVAIGPIPQAVQAQLPQNITHNQGLLVMRVMPGSPAEKAGLRQHDVLLAIDGQALITPEDLVKAVDAGKPGTTVNLEILRHGAVQKKDVTLAAREIRHPAMMLRHPRMNTARPLMPSMPATPDGVQSGVWQSFQAMTVTKQPDGSYHAGVEFLDEKGDKQQFEFKGSRDEVIEQVKQESRLPQAQKQQLLNALQDHDPGFPGDMFPAFPDFEQLEREFFQPPPWARYNRRGFWD
ncbi:S1C family serine protease [Thiolapillus sp.]